VSGCENFLYFFKAAASGRCDAQRHRRPAALRRRVVGAIGVYGGRVVGEPSTATAVRRAGRSGRCLRRV